MRLKCTANGGSNCAWGPTFPVSMARPLRYSVSQPRLPTIGILWHLWSSSSSTRSFHGEAYLHLRKSSNSQYLLEVSRLANNLYSQNKNEAMTVTSNATALSESEKSPSLLYTASEAVVSERPLPKSASAAEPVSPMPAHPHGSWFRRYSNLSRSPPPPDDIESALEAHDRYAPNRFLANLYHANQHAATGSSTSQGACMGNCNGLRL